MGEPSYAHVNAIKARDYRVGRGRNKPKISPDEMCTNGKPGFYRTRGRGGKWKKVHTRGIIVSATAMKSFSGHVKYTEV